MEHKIGETAGIVWRYLQKHGRTPITKLISDVSFEAKIEKNTVYMAIGWLARENKLNFSFDSLERRCDVWLK
ncbi:MAG: winged helix-turn-helix domain-containing protein [Methanocellales archaeon]